MGLGLIAHLSSWPLPVLICTSAQGSLHLFRCIQVIMLLNYIHTCTDKSEKSLILVFFVIPCITQCFFYFLLLQLIVEERLFEIVSFSIRRWSEALCVLTHWCPLHPVHLSLNSLFLPHPNGKWKMRGVWVICFGYRLGSWIFKLISAPQHPCFKC